MFSRINNNDIMKRCAKIINKNIKYLLCHLQLAGNRADHSGVKHDCFAPVFFFFHRQNQGIRLMAQGCFRKMNSTRMTRLAPDVDLTAFFAGNGD